MNKNSKLKLNGDVIIPRKHFDELLDNSKKNKKSIDEVKKGISESFSDRDKEIYHIKEDLKTANKNLKDVIKKAKRLDEELAFTHGSAVVHVKFIDGSECYFGNKKIELPIYEVPKSYLKGKHKIIDVPVGVDRAKAIIIGKAKKKTIKEVGYVRRAW